MQHTLLGLIITRTQKSILLEGRAQQALLSRYSLYWLLFSLWWLEATWLPCGVCGWGNRTTGSAVAWGVYLAKKAKTRQKLPANLLQLLTFTWKFHSVQSHTISWETCSNIWAYWGHFISTQGYSISAPKGPWPSHNANIFSLSFKVFIHSLTVPQKFKVRSPYNSKVHKYPTGDILITKVKNRCLASKTEPKYDQNPAGQTQTLQGRVQYCTRLG